MRDFFISKSVNIGALCGFLKSEKNSLYLDYLISNTPQLDLLSSDKLVSLNGNNKLNTFVYNF